MTGQHVGETGATGPHVLGAPDADGDDRHPGERGQPGRTPSTLELGLEEGGTAGDRSLGGHHHDLAAAQRVGRPLERLVAAGGPFDSDAADPRHELADDRCVEDFLLAEAADGATGPGHE